VCNWLQLTRVVSVQFLVIGGTGFIGPYVVRALLAGAHSVAVFNRGQTRASLPASVVQILGDRKSLAVSATEFKRLAPQVVIDMVAFTEQDGVDLVAAFRGIAERLVVISSMDVYSSYGRLLRLESGDPDNSLSTEDAPLRKTFYPYRSQAKDGADLLHDYEKILVERAASARADLPATVLRLPAVYGPGDNRHRLFEYLKRMDDGRSAILLNDVRVNWCWSRGFVANVAAAIALAATDERASGRTYNVADSAVYTEAQWVRSIGRATGWIGKILAVPEEQLPDHLETPYDWKHHCVGDCARIRSELGYQEPVRREEALRQTIAWERASPPIRIDPVQFDYAAEDAALARLEAG
jgi:nucleoside-diphosphate-sugar epimerase